jgi:DNA-directed RNA polymerase subunit RPC12/RpoP
MPFSAKSKENKEAKSMSDFLKRVGMAQAELKAPKNQYNSFGKYNYRSCEDILEAAKPINKKHGLVLLLTDKPVCIGQRYYIEATARLYDIESEQFIEATASAREADTKKGMDDSQVTGTASSYARKYALNGLYNIDDTKDADTDAYKKQTTTNSTAAPEYKCADCGKPFEAFRDPTSGKTFTPAEVFQMAKKRNADGVARCADCRKKKGGA